jgi:predicted PurR-regulated permease PerM
MSTEKPNRLDRLYKSMVVIALSLVAIVLFKDIIIPITFAAFFAVVLNPIAVRIERRTGMVLSIVIVLLGTFIVMVLAIWFTVDQLTTLVASLPDLEEKFFAMMMEASTKIHATLGISTEEQVTMLTDGAKELSAHLGSVLLSTTYLAYFFVQVPIYIFLFLLYRSKFYEFFLAYSSNSNMKWRREIEGVVSGYISGLAIVVLIAGVLNSIGLMVLGIEHAIFFGFVSGILTLIPYIGITIGATMPAMFALVTKDSAWYAVGVIALHATVQFLEGNFITPKVTGKKIAVNPMAAILALLMGGTLLGIAGMIVAVPAVGILKILIAGSADLKPFVILLEDKRPQQDAEKEQELAPESPTKVSSVS